MRTVRTRGTASDPLELHVEDDVIEPDLQWFISSLDQQLAGVDVKPGQTIQVGWLELQIEQDTSSGVLTFREPDLTGVIPAVWTPGVSRTLKHLRVQVSVCESLDVEPEFPFWTESALICTSLDEHGATSREMVLARTEAASGDSGWFIGCGLDHDHQDVGNLLRTSLYAAACRAPSAIPFLAVPAETEILVTAAGVTSIVLDGAKAEIAPGSFLEGLRPRRSSHR
jgi:hypothetical protein